MPTHFAKLTVMLVAVASFSSARMLAQTRPSVAAVTGTPVGFLATIQNAETKFNPSTLHLWLNDVEVPASSVTGPDANGLSTVRYAAQPTLPNGSTQTAKIQFQDDATPTPNTIIEVAPFTVSYQTIPADYATTRFSGTPGTLTVNAHQLPPGATRTPGDANSVANAETELANGYIDPGTGLPYDNYILVPDPIAIDLVNFSETPSGAGLDAGWFNAANTPAYADQPMPQGATGDMYALQFIAYAELKSGAYRMYVNSDDGFHLSVGPNGPDVVGLTLGQYDGGRSMTLDGDPAGFDFVVTQDGVYPFRLAYWEGTGDASVEWYSQDYATGTRYLVNAAVPEAVKTYPAGRGRAYVSRFLPYPGKAGVEQRPTITVDLVDDLTTVDPLSIRLTLDGATLSPTVTQNGKTRTVKWAAPAEYPLQSKHAGQLAYTEQETGKTRTIDYAFTIKALAVSDLPDTSFWIEVEDYDYDAARFTSDAGLAQATANIMPYSGQAFQGLSGVLEVDYHRTGPGPLEGTALAGYLYRAAGLNDSGWLDAAQTKPAYFVPFYEDTDGIAGQRPGGNTVTVNYRTGWSGGGNWYNYTRTMPKGTYAAYLAAGHWNELDPAQPGQIDGDLAKVVSGVGTSNQTLQVLGTWYGPGAGASAADVLTPLLGPDGTLAVFKLDGNSTTFRITDRAGDIDWVALVPQTGTLPPKVTQAIPANGAVVERSQPISIRIEDFSTAAVLDTVKLILDGQDVTAAANPTKTADLTTLHYTPSPLWSAGSAHTYIVRFADTSTPAQNFALTNTFSIAGGALRFTSITLNADGGVTIAWTGGGTLYTAAGLDGPWTAVPGASSPMTIPPPLPKIMQYWRLQQ